MMPVLAHLLTTTVRRNSDLLSRRLSRDQRVCGTAGSLPR